MGFHQRKTTLSAFALATVLAIGVSVPASAETRVYVTRDADGNPIFSDRQSTGAEAHVVKELPSMPAFRRDAPATDAPAPEKSAEQTTAYTSLSIVTPSNGTQLERGFNGELEVSGVLTPALSKGDRVVLKDRGQEIAQGQQTYFSLKDLDRGEHRFRLEVQNAAGETLLSSQTVTVFVQRSSSLAR